MTEITNDTQILNNLKNSTITEFIKHIQWFTIVTTITGKLVE